MKLPRLQFHISTALLLTVLASVIILANLRLRPETRDEGGTFVYLIVQGWPLAFHDFSLFGYSYGGIRKLDFVLNVLLNLAILAAAAFACEWAIQRSRINSSDE